MARGAKQFIPKTQYPLGGEQKESIDIEKWIRDTTEWSYAGAERKQPVLKTRGMQSGTYIAAMGRNSQTMRKSDPERYLKTEQRNRVMGRRGANHVHSAGIDRMRAIWSVGVWARFGAEWPRAHTDEDMTR